MSLPQCNGMKRDFLLKVSTHSLFLVHSSSSKVNETRLKDQFFLLNMKMKDEDNYIPFRERACVFRRFRVYDFKQLSMDKPEHHVTP